MGSAAEVKDTANCPRIPQYLELDSSAHLEKPIEPVIKGQVPKWLSGSLYRNGSGIYNIGKDSWSHLFDGFAVLHRWSIQNGTVTFRSTILDSEHYKKCVKADRLIGSGFGSTFPDPCRTLFGKVFSYFIPRPPGESDNTAVNIVEFGDRLFAMTETPNINEVEPDTLLKKEKHNLKDKLTVHMGTAHPLKSPDGKYMYYFGTHMNYKQAYNFVRIPISDDPKDPFAGAEVIGRVPSRWKMNISYTHSFGITENYFVHLEQPMTLNLPRMLTLSMRGVPISDCILCHPNEPISFLIISKKTGETIPITYLAPHGFVFHFVNCYEDSGHVVCDVCMYESGEVIRSAYLEEILKTLDSTCPSKLPDAVFTRFVFPLSLEGAVPGKNLVTLANTTATAVLREGTTNTLDVTMDQGYDQSYGFDLPRINEDYTGLKHRYIYGTSALATNHRRILKVDASDWTVKEWKCELTHQPGEPVFVPRPGATEEDDGIVLSTVLAVSTQHSSYLVILDAQSFEEIARASVPADVKMNLTFHGFFSQKH